MLLTSSSERGNTQQAIVIIIVLALLLLGFLLFSREASAPGSAGEVALPKEEAKSFGEEVSVQVPDSAAVVNERVPETNPFKRREADANPFRGVRTNPFE